MPLTDYTTYAEVRAALGTNDEEIEDVTLALPMYELGLVADLEDVSAALPADYTAVAAIDEASRTAVQKAFYEAVRLFAPYSVAGQLASSLPLFSPKQVTDGKAGFSRYADSPYKQAIDNAKKLFDRYRTRLADKYAGLSSGSSALDFRPFMSVVSPVTDPVVG